MTKEQQEIVSTLLNRDTETVLSSSQNIVNGKVQLTVEVQLTASRVIKTTTYEIGKRGAIRIMWAGQ